MKNNEWQCGPSLFPVQGDLYVLVTDDGKYYSERSKKATEVLKHGHLITDREKARRLYNLQRSH